MIAWSLLSVFNYFKRPLKTNVVKVQRPGVKRPTCSHSLCVCDTHMYMHTQIHNYCNIWAILENWLKVGVGSILKKSFVSVFVTTETQEYIISLEGLY